MKPSPETTQTPTRSGGRYVMHSVVPVGAIVLYTVLILLVLYTTTRATISISGIYPYAAYVLVGLLLAFLLRMVSTRYVLDEDSFRAWRLFGARRLSLIHI